MQTVKTQVNVHIQISNIYVQRVCWRQTEVCDRKIPDLSLKLRLVKLLHFCIKNLAFFDTKYLYLRQKLQAILYHRFSADGRTRNYTRQWMILENCDCVVSFARTIWFHQVGLYQWLCKNKCSKKLIFCDYNYI